MICLIIINIIIVIILTYLAHHSPINAMFTNISTGLHALFNMYGSIITALLKKNHNKTDLPSKSGEVAIITGGSRGLGIDVVKMLMQCDMHVIIGCRTVSAGEKVLESARMDGIKTGSVEVIKLDLNSFKSIKEFCKTVLEKHEKIKVLINNAAVMTDKYMTTEEGFESHFGINYLGHVLLTHLLLDRLKAAGTENSKSRIVNVSSCAHMVGKIHFDDIYLKKNFSLPIAYPQSKLAQVIYSNYMDRKFKNEGVPIESFSVHPGVVDTDLHPLGGTPSCIAKAILKNSKEGATSVVFTAVSPTLEGKGGSYIDNCLISPINPISQSESIQQTLYSLSKDLIDMKS